jgi:hypothetical protein
LPETVGVLPSAGVSSAGGVLSVAVGAVESVAAPGMVVVIVETEVDCVPKGGGRLEQADSIISSNPANRLIVFIDKEP